MEGGRRQREREGGGEVKGGWRRREREEQGTPPIHTHTHLHCHPHQRGWGGGLLHVLRHTHTNTHQLHYRRLEGRLLLSGLVSPCAEWRIARGSPVSNHHASSATARRSACQTSARPRGPARAVFRMRHGKYRHYLCNHDMHTPLAIVRDMRRPCRTGPDRGPCERAGDGTLQHVPAASGSGPTSSYT